MLTQRNFLPLIMVLAMGIGTLLAFVGMRWILDIQIRWMVAVIAMIPTMAGALTVFEFLRQKKLNPDSRFRFSLGFIFLMIAMVAVFFGAVSYEIRATTIGFERNKVLQGELEQILQGGTVSIGNFDCRRITCDAARPTFSDSDLHLLLQKCRHPSQGTQELSGLFLGSTSVTEKGIGELAECDQLELLFLPSVTFSDQTIASISKCKKLKYLGINEKKLTKGQIAVLRKELPKVKLNGKTWGEF